MNKELKWIENAIKNLAKTAVKDGFYWRASYTPEDQCGAALLQKWMEDAGFQTRFDQVGNLYGRIQGKSDTVFLAGSHRDTVANGGHYDGALGIITAIAAGGALYRAYGTPEMTLEVVALCEEEGSRFLSGYVGSRAISGMLSDSDLQEQDADGISLRDALSACGYYNGELPMPRKDVSQFLELHIEQGGVLEKTKQQIGIVTTIVGLLVGDIIFHGLQNHAGTTPMSLRCDPVPAAASFIEILNHWALSKGSDLVCTIGNITVEPGKSNVIAGKVTLTFDIRSGDQLLLDEAKEMLQSLLEKFPAYKPELVYACQEPPAPMDTEGIDTLATLAEKQNAAWTKIASGAGHDSQIIAPKIKTNMIFVPSKDGISHSPDEFTSLKDIAPGYALRKAYMKEAVWQRKEK